MSASPTENQAKIAKMSDLELVAAVLAAQNEPWSWMQNDLFIAAAPRFANILEKELPEWAKT